MVISTLSLMPVVLLCGLLYLSVRTRLFCTYFVKDSVSSLKIEFKNYICLLSQAISNVPFLRVPFYDVVDFCQAITAKKLSGYIPLLFYYMYSAQPFTVLYEEH